MDDRIHIQNIIVFSKTFTKFSHKMHFKNMPSDKKCKKPQPVLIHRTNLSDIENAEGTQK